MATIEGAFSAAREAGRAALIPFFTAGYPTLGALAELVHAAEEAGADLVEIGIPFSDPLADGPVLQRAATLALEAGTRVERIFSAVAAMKPGRPRVFLTYFNPVLRRGLERFAEDTARAGLSGAIVPDLPWPEAGPLREAFSPRELALIPLVAPTSTDDHLDAIRGARGFVYAVSVTGVTGARRTVGAGVDDLVARIRRHVDLPVAIGFGISGPEQARRIGRVADGVIVGSALTEAIMRDPKRPAEAAYAFLRPMAEALQNSEGLDTENTSV